MNHSGLLRKYGHCYAWIAPFFVIFLVLQLYPTLYGFYLSLTKYGGLEAPQYIGLKNFQMLLRDKKVLLSLGNTVVLWALIVPIRVFLATLMGAVLNEKRSLLSKIYMKIVLLPYVTAALVVAIVFRALMSTEGGAINNLLGMFGIAPIGWLTDARFSKVSIALMNLWRMTGYFSLVMLAGMQKIPTAVYEAAMIDGAGTARRFFSITLPLMVQEMAFVFMISTIWVFQNVADSMLLTRGGPMNSSLSFVYYIYQNAYEFSNKMGYASALSVVLFVLLLVLSIFLMRFYMKKVED